MYSGFTSVKYWKYVLRPPSVHCKQICRGGKQLFVQNHIANPPPPTAQDYMCPSSVGSKLIYRVGNICSESHLVALPFSGVCTSLVPMLHNCVFFISVFNPKSFTHRPHLQGTDDDEGGNDECVGS